MTSVEACIQPFNRNEIVFSSMASLFAINLLRRVMKLIYLTVLNTRVPVSMGIIFLILISFIVSVTLDTCSILYKP